MHFSYAANSQYWPNIHTHTHIYICVCVCVCVCVRICVFTWVRKYRKCIYLYIQIYVSNTITLSKCIFPTKPLHTTTRIYIYICIYIYVCMYTYSHPQKDCSAVSQLFSGARNAGSFKLGSKTAYFYVRHITYRSAIGDLASGRGFNTSVLTYR